MRLCTLKLNDSVSEADKHEESSDELASDDLTGLDLDEKEVKKARKKELGYIYIYIFIWEGGMESDKPRRSQEEGLESY